MDVSLSELREMVMNREAWRAAIHEVAKSRTRLSDWTELNWTEYKEYKQLLYTSHPLFPIVFLFNFYWSIGGFAMLLLSGIEQSQRRQWQATPVLLHGKSHGRKSLMGCSSWGREKSDTTDRLHFHFSLSCIGEGNGNPLQCSCLENPRDGGAWWVAIYGVAQSWTRLKRLSSRIKQSESVTHIHISTIF